MTAPSPVINGGGNQRNTNDVLMEHSRSIAAVETSITGLERDITGVRESQDSMNRKLDRLISEQAKNPHVSFREIASTTAACVGALGALAVFIMWFATTTIAQQVQPLKADLELQRVRTAYELQIRDERLAQIGRSFKFTPSFREFSANN